MIASHRSASPAKALNERADEILVRRAAAAAGAGRAIARKIPGIRA